METVILLFLRENPEARRVAAAAAAGKSPSVVSPGLCRHSHRWQPTQASALLRLVP